MTLKDEIIFLIESDFYNKHLLGITIEKQTNCKVFNFFSLEESVLYAGLHPSLIIHDRTHKAISNGCFERPVHYLDISNTLPLAPTTHPQAEITQDIASTVMEVLSKI